MKQVNAITDQLEEFANDHVDDLEKAKDALSKKNWKDFCKSIKPVLKKAEELGMTAKGTAEKIYNDAKQETTEFYIKASHFAADSAKSFADNAQKMGKKCSSATKSFFLNLKEFSMTVYKETKTLVQNLAHEAHKQGKSFVDKLKDSGKDLFSKIRKRT